jgi:hypothetical protein
LLEIEIEMFLDRFGDHPGVQLKEADGSIAMAGGAL